MENDQSPQQQQLEPSGSKQAQSKRRWAKPVEPKLLHALIRRYPWLVWLGVTAFLTVITYISFVSLISVGDVKKQVSAPKTAITAQPNDSPKSSSVPWLLGIFVLATGSLAIAGRRQIYALLPRLHQRLNSSSQRVLKRRQRRKQLLQGKQQPIHAGSRHLNQQTLDTEKATAVDHLVFLHDIQLTDNQPVAPASEISTDPVSPAAVNQLKSGEELLSELEIVPLKDNQEHELQVEVILPLTENTKDTNSEQESLAEMLDIRKKLPLAVILGERYRDK